METIDQLSTYIYMYVYVDNFQNNIYIKEIMILFLLRFEVLQIYSAIIYGSIAGFLLIAFRGWNEEKDMQ